MVTLFLFYLYKTSVSVVMFLPMEHFNAWIAVLNTLRRKDLKLDQPIETLAYSIDGFCLAVGLGRSETYTDIREGRLKTRKRGKRRIILKKDAMAYLESLEKSESTAA